MFEFIRSMFVQDTAIQQAHKELAEARKQLLTYQNSAEYSNAMVGYYTKKIERLEGYVG